MKHTLSLLVEDKSGVLARVSALCARRAINIHSLAVGPTHEIGRSRLTLVVDADQVEQEDAACGHVGKPFLFDHDANVAGLYRWGSHLLKKHSLIC